MNFVSLPAIAGIELVEAHAASTDATATIHEETELASALKEALGPVRGARLRHPVRAPRNLLREVILRHNLMSISVARLAWKERSSDTYTAA